MSRPTATWQRNTIGAVVVGAALAVIVAMQSWPQWSGYRDTIVPQATAQAGASISVGGLDWQVASVRRGDDAATPEASAPPTGASLVVVTVTRSGAVPPLVCTTILTDGRRRWSPEVARAVPLAPGTTGVCGLPGPLQSTFVVPAGTPLQAVDVTGPGGRILLRLLL